MHKSGFVQQALFLHKRFAALTLNKDLITMRNCKTHVEKRNCKKGNAKVICTDKKFHEIMCL